MSNTVPRSVTLVGTSDALGVPRVYCSCEVCEEARGDGLNRRTRSSAVVEGPEGRFWIDCGPDWRQQMERQGLKGISDVLITHAHQDHIGGIPELFDVRRWTSSEVTLRAPTSVVRQIVERFPWIERGLRLVGIDGKFPLLGWEVTTWEVSHGFNGRSFAFRFDSPSFSWVYCPDSINLTAEEKRPLFGLDLLVLGTSFYREEAPLEGRSVYDMVEACKLLEEIRPRKAVFTHLSHKVDVSAAYSLPGNVEVARDGVCLRLERNA